MAGLASRGSSDVLGRGHAQNVGEEAALFLRARGHIYFPAVLGRKFLQNAGKKLKFRLGGTMTGCFTLNLALQLSRRLPQNRGTSSLSKQLATLLLHMGQQLTPLHIAIVISSAAGSSLSCCRRSVSSSRRTAALKSARHSSLVSPCPLAPGTSRQVAQKPPSSASPG